MGDETESNGGLGKVVARNLSLVRELAGITQQELAYAARISRATISLLESGGSDPRLSTLVEIAAALGISPLVLLLGSADVRAVIEALEWSKLNAHTLSELDEGKMRELAGTGRAEDGVRAARLGASWGRSRAGGSPSAVLTAGLFSKDAPGAGTVIGAALGARLLVRGVDPVSSSAGGGGLTNCRRP